MTNASLDFSHPDKLLALDDAHFQAYLLEGVSRTFALTIPQLPPALHSAVANAYLLCRIIDTIEDEVSLSAEQKAFFCAAFIEIVNTGEHADSFAQQLTPLLSAQTLPAEHCLIQLTPRVIKITRSFQPEQIHALANCVATMAHGMPLFQAMNLQAGLNTLADMDNYCYHVAGCVGEMLAKLFCHYSPQIAIHQQELLRLSISFGQGLQMTNILKDIWDDAARGVCWLPQEIFTQTGFELKNLTTETHDAGFYLGLEQLIGIAQTHLEDALHYVLLIPTHETGIRKFCLWALGMAILTLRKIKQNLTFKQSSEVKITRRSVKATMLLSHLTVRSNHLLALLFHYYSKDLKTKRLGIIAYS